MAVGMAGRPAAYLAGSAEVGAGRESEARVALAAGPRIGVGLRWLARAWFQGWVLYVSAIRPWEPER